MTIEKVVDNLLMTHSSHQVIMFLRELKQLSVYDVKTPYPLPMFFSDGWNEVLDELIKESDRV